MCHGPGALILATNPTTEKSIFDGARATGFSNSEEAQTPYNDFVNILPFSLEDKIKELGGKYEKANQDWGVKVIWDQGILTGKSPMRIYPANTTSCPPSCPPLNIHYRSKPCFCWASRGKVEGNFGSLIWLCMKQRIAYVKYASRCDLSSSSHL